MVAAALAKDPAQRPPGADAFASAVEWLRRRPVTGAALPVQPVRVPTGPPGATAAPTPADVAPARSGRHADDGPSTAVLDAVPDDGASVRGLRRRWRRPPLPLVGLVALIGLVVGGALVGGRPWQPDQPSPAALPTLTGPTPAAATSAGPTSAGPTSAGRRRPTRRARRRGRHPPGRAARTGRPRGR